MGTWPATPVATAWLLAPLAACGAGDPPFATTLAFGGSAGSGAHSKPMPAMRVRVGPPPLPCTPLKPRSFMARSSTFLRMAQLTCNEESKCLVWADDRANLHSLCGHDIVAICEGNECGGETNLSRSRVPG
jgi:hypothetical protein